MLKDTVLLSKRRFYWRFHAAKAKNKLNSNVNYPRNYPTFFFFLFSFFSFLFFLSFCLLWLCCTTDVFWGVIRSSFSSVNWRIEKSHCRRKVDYQELYYIRCRVEDTVHAGEIRVSLWLQVAHNSQATGSAVCHWLVLQFTRVHTENGVYYLLTQELPIAFACPLP